MKAFAVALLLAFPLDPSLWLLDPQQPDQGVVFSKKGGVAFNFPTVDTGSYTGNLFLPWPAPLSGTLTATIQVVTFPAGDKPVRFIPAPGPCVSPAMVHLYFQTGDLYNDVDGTRWWSNPVAWTLQDGTVMLEVDLTPDNWSSTFGHPASTMPADFANTLSHPTFVGLTFGGGCSFGHGVATAKGTAQFRLLSFSE